MICQIIECTLYTRGFTCSSTGSSAPPFDTVESYSVLLCTCYSDGRADMHVLQRRQSRPTCARQGDGNRRKRSVRLWQVDRELRRA